jgi:hypothetical protein
MEIGQSALLKVIVVRRPGRGLVRPRFGRAQAFLSRNNMTYAIMKGRGGRLLRSLLKKQPAGR